MKKRSILLFAALLVVSIYQNLKAQSIEIQLNSATYANGYDITCHGASNGSIEAICINGEDPFAFLWSNGATAQKINNLVAGTYTVTIHDWNNNYGEKEIILREPDGLGAFLTADVCGGGTNICEQGDSTGHIYSEIQGGSPPYTYLWNTGSQSQTIGDVSAGTYTLTVTDINSCTATQNITLTEPSALHIVSISSPQHHGYNVSCNGGSDGAIVLNLAGGVPPYSYQWNNGSMDQNPQDLVARVYMVRVYDQNGAMVTGQITLTQAPVIHVELTPSVYGNGFNLSSFNSFDGSITTNVTGGATPYTYTWQTLPQKTTANLTNVIAGNYLLKLVDANGCTSFAATDLRAPERSDWTIFGNAGTNPTNQFIGTSDNNDLSFRTNNTERLSLNANGDIKMNSLSGNGTQLLLVDNNGILLKQNPNTPIGLSTIWMTNGNLTTANNYIGTNNSQPLIFKTNVSANPSFGEKMRIMPDGKVGIGTNNPQELLQLGDLFTFHNGGSKVLGFNHFYNNGNSKRIDPLLPSATIGFDNSGAISFKTASTESGNVTITNWNNALTINNDGNIGINTQPDAGTNISTVWKLKVNGRVKAKEFEVSVNWFDFVFENSYKRMSMDQLDEYLKENKHLPYLESGKTIETNGLKIGATMQGFVQNIEETRLDVIDLYKMIKELKEENKALKDEINAIRKN